MKNYRASLKWDDKKENVILVPDPNGIWIVSAHGSFDSDIQLLKDSSNRFMGGIDPYEQKES